MRVTIEFERAWSGLVIDEETQAGTPFQGRFDLLRALEALVEPALETGSAGCAEPR